MGYLRIYWKYCVGIGLVLVVGSIVYFCAHVNGSTTEQLNAALIHQSSSSSQTSHLKSASSSSQTGQKVFVDVKGAVVKPGIYHVKAQTRLFEVVKLAGGLLPTGDTSQLNLAQAVEDQMVIYVPKFGEEVPVSTAQPTKSVGGNGASSSASSQIDLNHATVDQLQQVSGIGPKKAQDIVDYRDQNGAFQSVDDLQKVNGIGAKTLEKLKPQFRLG